MTSEGQQAGQQPAEATSGGRAEAFGPDGFPPDSDDRARSSAPPATGFPTSYAPPPQSTPNGGSPFVVPTVFGQPAAERPFPDAPADRYGIPIAPPGQAPMPGQADRATPSPFAAPATGYTPPPTGSARVTGSAPAQVPAANSDDSRPQRGSGLFGTASVPARDPGPDHGAPSSAWAPPAPPDGGPSATDNPFARSTEPHPYRPGDDGSGSLVGNPSTEIAGFAPGSPTRAGAGLDTDAPSGDDQESPSTGRPPGLSAFGDQRVRVPGATLADLPDGPPAGLPGRDAGNGSVTRRDGDGSALPRRTVPTGDPLLSFGTTADSFEGFRPARSGRAGGGAPQSAALGSPDSPVSGGSSASFTPRASQAFGTSRGPVFGGNPADDPRGATGPNAAASSGPTSDGFQFGEPVVSASGPPSDRPAGGSPFGDTSAGDSLFGGPPQYGPSSQTGPSPFGPSSQTGPSPFGPSSQTGPSPFGPAAQFNPQDAVDAPDPGGVFGSNGSGGNGSDAQRAASFSSGGAPVAAESRNGSVPQPRDPAARPAVGTARPVSASASVPTASRVVPPDVEDIPPPSVIPQARVYGRAAPAVDAGDEAERSDQPIYGRPVDAGQGGSGGQQGPVSYGRPSESPQDPPVAPAGFGPAPFARPAGEDQIGFGAAPISQPKRPEDGQNGPGAFGPMEAQPPAVAPQSPGRASGRATASARVTPPPPTQPGAPKPSDHYSEHTTDISHRGESDRPYVPAPALSSLHARPPLVNGFPPPADGVESPDRMRMGGVFPGPASRATVTPPVPEETTSWPRPDEPDQGRFDQFKAEAEAAVPTAAPSTPHVRMVPVILGVIIGAALVVGLAMGIPWLLSRGSTTGGITVSAGDCVKRSGNEAVKAKCGEPGAFQVASVAESKDKCGDPTQPYVVNPTDKGKTQVLCLKPPS